MSTIFKTQAAEMSNRGKKTSNHWFKDLSLTYFSSLLSEIGEPALLSKVTQSPWTEVPENKV